MATKVQVAAEMPRIEMLQVADAVAREKSIDREQVLQAMETAIEKAGRSKYGLEHDIRAEIDRKSGDIKLLRYQEVVETVENEATQIGIKEAQRRNRLSPLRAEITRLETQITKLEQRRGEIETALAAPEIYSAESKSKLQELLQSQAQIKRDLEAAETAWLDATQRLDAESAAG